MDGGHFGQRVREAREHRQLTQDALADLAGMDVSSLRNYERRETPPRYGRYIPALEHALGVKLVDENADRRAPKKAATVSEIDPRLSEVDADRLVRALSAKLAATARTRAAALPLVDRLAAGDWVSEAQRDAMVGAIKAALAADVAELSADGTTPNGAHTSANGAVEATTGSFGGPFGITGTDKNSADSDGEKSNGDSVQA